MTEKFGTVDGYNLNKTRNANKTDLDSPNDYLHNIEQSFSSISTKTSKVCSKFDFELSIPTAVCSQSVWNICPDLLEVIRKTTIIVCPN